MNLTKSRETNPPREHSERRFFVPLRDAMAASGHFDPEFTLGDVQRAFGVAEVNNYELANKSGNCGIRDTHE